MLKNVHIYMNNNYLMIDAFDKIATSIDTLNENVDEYLQAVKGLGNFIKMIGKFFDNLVHYLNHPRLLFLGLEPWFMVLLMILIILKIIGFKTEKWIRLFFILFIITIVV